MKQLEYPFTEEKVRSLKAGEAVTIKGPIHTGRDKFHKWFADGKPIPVDFKDGALYHCGPVIVKEKGGGWKVKAAGPTTSVRENPYEPKFIESSGVRLVIGKGGMDAATLAAMKKSGAVYIQAVGGAAAVSARSLKVTGVDFLDEFGAAEACWHFEADGFTGVVAMDSHGKSLFAEVEKASGERLKGLISGGK